MGSPSTAHPSHTSLTAQPQLSVPQRIAAIIGLAALAVAGNMAALPLTFGVDLISGPLRLSLPSIWLV